MQHAIVRVLDAVVLFAQEERSSIMERPVSAASSGTAGTRTSTTAHKRNASTKNAAIKAAAGPSMPALFVTNLRLLNIDRYADWPNITAASFQDARGKIKCTEYALYQLFRLYDPSTAADKLQPFFPPLEPLQSVNLRAALYRCLNELKKNGVLGRETVLRKTMLDECSGEKFWEVCLGFSVVVLKKVSSGKRRTTSIPVAERLGIAQSMNNGQKESMLPLAIAHKAALGKVLEEKHRKGETYTALYDALTEKDSELRQRKVRSEDQARKTKSLQPQKLNAVETIVTKNWIGSTELRDALVEGDTCAKGDGMLVKSFEDVWRSRGTPERTGSGGAEIGLLQNLSDRATEQNARMRKWQNYYDKLVGSKPASTQSSRPVSGTQRGAIRFDRHRGLNLRDESPDRSPPMPQRRTRHPTASRYDEILTAMREELRKTSSNRSRPGAAPVQTPGAVRRVQTQPVAMPARKPSLAPGDTSPGATDPQARSPTAVPIRFGQGRRVASRSRSYQQPKVESQREPLQLKSELFSPLKGKRSSTASSILSSPIEEEDVPQQEAGVNGNQRQSPEDVHQNPGVSQRSSSSEPREGTSSNKENDEVHDLNEHEFKKPAKTNHSKRPRPSLADRTRQSMAFNSHEDVNGLLPDRSSSESTPEERPDPIVEDIEPADSSANRRRTLLERTRQSISLAPPASATQPKSRKSAHARSRTSIYPVNQFETPKKGGVRRSTVGLDENERRDITPMEDLLSPEAEYDSVFKSRPKIALSPVLSPFAEGASSGRMSEVGLDVGGSSPFAG